MITKEEISGNEKLKTLTEEQQQEVLALTTKSENDAVNDAVGKKYKEVLDSYDSSVKTILGIERNKDEKSTDYAARAMKSFVEFKEKNEALTKENAEYAEKLKNGITDEKMKEQLGAKDATIAKLQADYKAEQEKMQAVEQKHKDELFGMRVDNEIASSFGGMKFNRKLSKELLEDVKHNAKDYIKTLNPYLVDNNGQEKVAFRTSQGIEMRNPAKGQELYTVGEMLSDYLGKRGVLETTPSGGGNGGNGGGGNPTAVAFGEAKTKVEAMTEIEKSLSAQGLTKYTAKFNEAMTKAISDNKQAYDALPDK